MVDEEIKVKVPEWLDLMVTDYAHLLDTTRDQIVREALESHMPALEARRKLKEARAYPRGPPAGEG